VTDNTLIALAERCEAATGPDREVDEAIYDAFVTLTGTPPYVCHMLFGKPRCTDSPPPYFTASIDAAMTLVDDASWWRVDRGATGDCYARVNGILCQAATPALALCAAALRARAA
jgi:hypothetical protein